MTLSKEYKCLFIHINKTAGRSISSSLFDIVSQHLTVKELFTLDLNKDEKEYRLNYWKEGGKFKIVKEYWNDYFKFTFIRNPWDRKLSDYFFNVKNGLISNKITFTQYIKDNHTNSDIWNSPGLEWIEYDDGSIDPSIFIGKFENLQEDFDVICDKLHIPRRILPILNKTEHLPYWKYYTEETKNLIAKKYKKDIDYFGYEFGK